VSRKCKHLSMLPIGSPGVVMFRCNWCGDYVPLGDSDETDERVALEIRAAALAAAWNPDDGRWHGFLSLGMCSPGAEHGPLIERDIAEGRGDKYPRDLNDYYAGHLARCIVESGTAEGRGAP
jgi:hypothetical protein